MSGETRVDVARLRREVSFPYLPHLDVARLRREVSFPYLPHKEAPYVMRRDELAALLDVAEAAHRVEGDNGVIRNWRGLIDALARLDFGEGT